MIDPYSPSYGSTTIAIHHITYGGGALPTSLLLFSLVVTIASIFLCSVIAMYFYRSYRFSGFGYLLGLPTGFAILAASFVFEHLHVVYSYSYTNESLENLFFWIQLSLQSEGFAFIALSYMLKTVLALILLLPIMAYYQTLTKYFSLPITGCIPL